jgi:hypothetical protein
MGEWWYSCMIFTSVIDCGEVLPGLFDRSDTKERYFDTNLAGWMLPKIDIRAMRTRTISCSYGNRTPPPTISYPVAIRTEPSRKTVILLFARTWGHELAAGRRNVEI